MNGRRIGSMVLACSLGLNVALGGVLLSQAVARKKERVRMESGQWRRHTDWRERSEWQSRSRRDSDFTRNFPRLQQDQITRLRKMRREMEGTISPLRTEINTLQAMMREELGREQPLPERLDSLVTETARVQSLIQQQSLRLILREREILTPEQYRSFIRIMMPGQFNPRESGRYRPPQSSRGSMDSRDRGNAPPSAQHPPPHRHLQ